MERMSIGWGGQEPRRISGKWIRVVKFWELPHYSQGGEVLQNDLVVANRRV